jgi:hypothetical protein
MLEKVNQLAEQAATNVSRRQFLGRLGRSAMAVAAASGGLLAVPAIANLTTSHAGRFSISASVIRSAIQLHGGAS